jgi:hypothetical protein
MPHSDDIQIRRPLALFLNGCYCVFIFGFTDQNIRRSSGVDFVLYIGQGNRDGSLSLHPPPPPACDCASHLTNYLFYSFINSPSQGDGLSSLSTRPCAFHLILIIRSIFYPGIWDSLFALLVAGEHDILTFQGAYICKKASS